MVEASRDAIVPGHMPVHGRFIWPQYSLFSDGASALGAGLAGPYHPIDQEIVSFLRRHLQVRGGH